MNDVKKKALLAASIAGLIAAGNFVTTPVEARTGDLEACYGVNACKGKGACGGANHACAGKNECKGAGWVEVAKGQCGSIGGTTEPAKA